MLTAECARQRLNYDPETGVLTWKSRPREDFATSRAFAVWNARWAGKEAGTINKAGYRIVSIFAKKYYEHRIIWLIVTGEWPTGEIDHESGARAVNLMGGMRDATAGQNRKNTALRSDNMSGVHGVSWDAQRKRWRVRIGSDGKQHLLGMFSDLDKAIEARLSVEREYGFHPNHGRKAA